MSLLVCAQPATGDPAAFVPVDVPALLQRLSTAPHLPSVCPASRLEVRPAPDIASSGIAALDTLTAGLPRGCLSEVYGPSSSGCTSLLMAALAAATRRKEACALVDASNGFDPQSAAKARVDLRQLLWVRCSALTKKISTQNSGPQKHSALKPYMVRLTQALKATDLLLQSGGFGLVAIDLSGIPHAAARRIPLASWFRFRRAVENTPAILLMIGQGPCARTCASLVLRLGKKPSALSHLPVHTFPNQPEALNTPAHARLLERIEVTVELQRARLERKPPQSDKTGFETRTAWGRS